MRRRHILGGLVVVLAVLSAWPGVAFALGVTGREAAFVQSFDGGVVSPAISHSALPAKV